MEKHKYHLKQLETILRMVDNDAIPLDQVSYQKVNLETTLQPVFEFKWFTDLKVYPSFLYFYEICSLRLRRSKTMSSIMWILTRNQILKKMNFSMTTWIWRTQVRQQWRGETWKVISSNVCIMFIFNFWRINLKFNTEYNFDYQACLKKIHGSNYIFTIEKKKPLRKHNKLIIHELCIQL